MNEYHIFLEHLSRLISSHSDERVGPSLSQMPLTTIRLHNKSNSAVGQWSTTKVDVVLSTVQTMDSHLYYLEFFRPQLESGAGNSPCKVTPSPSPPSYDEVRKRISAVN
ncbi:hypothetical protein ACHAXN_002354 [Cyclotella atomus]